ncbi:Flp pilus assembly protein TadG [Devosia lucknowensis]|uniref:Flp pilus assembly protein TadG n=1 Tax=Devosia lucknowensis TaxID=1096929 RepID=A0A1Y6FM05_9HYPH|nr:TadE/TadG family type IV pilus assembly protein [Devosia lucknowensis]SMQ75905.1 Flp pilus assembly protein TadG [Devosia lucknowensis]
MARRRGFLKNEKGASIVEFALLVPVLLLLLIGTVTLFDLFRTLQSVEKATFTVGDMLSRQPALTQARLDAMMTLTRQMVPTANDGGIRVSSIAKQGGRMVLQWTQNSGTNVPTTPLPMSVLPDVAEGDSVLLTESFVPHRAFMDLFGFDVITFGAQAAHRPRFVSKISFN